MPRSHKPRRPNPAPQRGATRLTFPLGPALVLLGLLLLLTAIARIRLLDVPLERDEGEYAYAGQLMLQGIPPYQLAYNMKLPGIYVAYASALGLFGQTARGVHLGLLVVNLATIVLVFALTRRLFGSFAAIAAAVAYAILSLSPSVLGFAAHATHFVALFAVAGVLGLLEAERRGRAWLYAVSGVLLGTALVMKQHGAVFVLLGILYPLTAGFRGRDVPRSTVIARSALVLAGSILPFAAISFWLWRSGVFEKFWFWCFSYAGQYASELTPAQGLKLFAFTFPQSVQGAELLWLIAAAGLWAVWARGERRSEAVLITSFLVASALGASLGLYFRPHYFVLMLPALAILVGAAVNAAAELLARQAAPPAFCFLVPSLALGVAVGQTVVGRGEILFRDSPTELLREVYGLNPFPEAPELARYIAEHSNPSDRIVVLGSEPEVYFYSGRHSATGYIYTYGLMEEQPYALRMQKEMIREVEASRPQFLVYVRIPASWGVRPKSERLIMDWSPNYVEQNYRIVGIVEIQREGSQSRWDADAVGYAPKAPLALFLFQRR